MRWRERYRDATRLLFRSPDAAAVDGLAMQYLRPLLDSFTEPPPMSSTSLRPVALALLVNELRINRREAVLEFGCGVSTLVLAKAADLYSLEVQILAIEQSAEWVDRTWEQLSEEGLGHIAEIQHVPTIDGGAFGPITVGDRHRDTSFDLVVIDGPNAYAPGTERARIANRDFLYGKLAPAAAILVDDVHRAGELALLDSFVDDDFRTQRLYDTIGLATRGPAFDTAPIRD